MNKIIFKKVKEEKILVRWEGEISILKITHIESIDSKHIYKFIEGECQNFVSSFFDYLVNHPELDKHMYTLCPEAVIMTDDNELYKYHYGLNIRSNELYNAIINEYSPKTPEEKLLCEIFDF